MAKIPFTVSARTARLIGRENIASSKGAIVELVKNCYDADSPLALIYFNRKKDELYIIDFGDGMTEEIIINHWMTIGTDNKANDFFTKSGRIKAGAKGIGRFALDKLGTKCEMTTKFDINVHKSKDENSAYLWEVNWTDFEGEFKTIDKIEANLDSFEEYDFKKYLLDHIDNITVRNIIDNYPTEHGTVLKISGLRDNWDDHYIEQVFDDLEVLVPPKEQSTFKLFLISEDMPNKYGEVHGSVCDDYDYKVIAKADKSQNINIKIYRNEYDIETIPLSFFKRDFMQAPPYRKKDFQKSFYEKNITFKETIKGFSDADEDNTFDKIGDFEFTLYFMKRTFSTPDLEKYYYNKFSARDRQFWLDKFGGIKLFRDGFRVRPYGEIKDSAFDWMGLGQRQAKSPAAASKPAGGWKVGPDNVSGAINITRLGNIDFQDKSSREGLQESKTFQIFKKMILHIISIFEEDRANIFKEMKLFYDEINIDAQQKAHAAKLAKELLEKAKKQQQKNNSSSNNKIDLDDIDAEKLLLAKSIEEKEETIENLKDEQKLLRGMASSGIVIASFSHDLSKISHNLNSRIDKLKALLHHKISENEYKDVEDRKNPYYLLEKMRKQDLKLQNWLNFSLGVAKKDKRRRKDLKFKSYFNLFKNDWQMVLEHRAISLNIKQIDRNISMRVFEIDIDSIFNNLLVNSIDAFTQSKIDRERRIVIKITEREKEIIIDYIDNGPGLSEDITDVNKIFEPMFTTKVNKHTGDEEGTGLGMWLIKSIVHDNNGSVQLLIPKNGGFGLRVIFPKKFIRK